MRPIRGFTLIELVVVMAIMAILLAIVISNLRTGKMNQDLRQASLRLMDDIRYAQNMTLVGTTKPVCMKTDTTVSPPVVTYRENCTTLGTVCASDNTYSCQNIASPGGYGVYFSDAQNDRYTMYSDFSSSLRSLVLGQPPGTVPPDPVRRDALDTDIKTIALPANIVVCKLTMITQFADPTNLPPGKTCVDASPSFNVFPNSNAMLQGPFSMAWTLPNGKLYTFPHNVNMTFSQAPCPDYRVEIILKQQKTKVCRQITINGASGVVEEATTACPAFTPFCP